MSGALKVGDTVYRPGWTEKPDDIIQLHVSRITAKRVYTVSREGSNGEQAWNRGEFPEGIVGRRGGRMALVIATTRPALAAFMADHYRKQSLRAMEQAERFRALSSAWMEVKS